MVLAKLHIMVVIELLLSSTLAADYTTTRQAQYHVVGLLANKDDAIELSNTKALSSEMTASRSKWVRSRKMGAVRAMGRIGKSANPTSIGKCSHDGKGESNIECELVDRRSLPSSVKLADLIPFSSDYHAPKTHPPKNN